MRFSSLTEADVKYLLPEGTSEKMLHFLSQAFRQLTATRRGELWGYHDLRDEVKAQKYEGSDRGESGNASSIEGLLWRLDSRFDRPNSIFSDHEHIPLAEMFRPGRCTVLQLSDIEQNEQQVVVATLLAELIRRAWRPSAARPKAGSDSHLPYPVFTLLEEAHRFAPAGQTVVSTNILKQILSEGRKFGVGIGLITQRPGKLDQDVLSQCMTQVIMRIVNPVDQDTVAKSVEGAGRQLLNRVARTHKGPGRHLRRRRQHPRHVSRPRAHHQTRRRDLRRPHRMGALARAGRARTPRPGRRRPRRPALQTEKGRARPRLPNLTTAHSLISRPKPLPPPSHALRARMRSA